MLKQEILNYEYDILSNHQIRKPELSLRYDPYVFHQWNLSKIINQLLMAISVNHIDVKWFGNNRCSAVLAFFYSVFKVCSAHENIIIKLKYSMYQISQYYLSLSQQKALIQFLSLLYEKIDLSAFFIQNRHIQKILIKIFDALHGSRGHTPHFLIEFSKQLFDFISIQQYGQLSDSVLAISLRQSCHSKNQISRTTNQMSNQTVTNSKPIFIVSQKSCYFVCEEASSYQPNKSVSSQKNNGSQIIKEEEAIEQQSRIPSFLINKKHIKSETKIPYKAHEKYDFPNVAMTSSINPSKMILNEKIKQILQNSPTHKHGSPRSSLYHKLSKQKEKKHICISKKSPINSSSYYQSLSRSPETKRSRHNSTDRKDYNSSRHHRTIYNKDTLQIDITKKIDQGKILCQKMNSARSQQKSLNKFLTHNQTTLRNSLASKEPIIFFQNKKNRVKQSRNCNNSPVTQPIENQQVSHHQHINIRNAWCSPKKKF